MKLLYISTPSFADCDFPLIRTFQEKGLDVTYLILLPPFMLRSTLVDIKRQIPRTGIFKATQYPEFQQFENYMDMNNVYVSNRIKRKSYSWSYIKENILLWDFIRKGNYDIVHCDTLFTGIRKLLYRISKCWITTFHDPFPHTGEIKRNSYRRYLSAIKNSNGYVLLNSNQLEQFCQTYKVDKSRILINRLGIYDNIRSFVHMDNTKNSNNILFFGRISPYKGVEYLCEAMKSVHKIIPEATLTIAGGGKYYFDIGKYTSLPYITVKNYYINMEELAALLVNCSLCVCPYTDATQSGVIMTSFSLGKPVVATNVGGLSECIENKKSGILVPAKDPDALAKAIISLLNNRRLLNSMSDYILNEYNQGEKSWEKIAEKYITYYQNLLNTI